MINIWTLTCTKHKVKLEPMGGESAHPANWYCPICEGDKSPQKGEGKSLDAPETEPLPHALDRRGIDK